MAHTFGVVYRACNGSLSSVDDHRLPASIVTSADPLPRDRWRFGTARCGRHGDGQPRLLAEAVVAQMRSEYQDIDIEAASDSIGGHHLPGFDFNFYCLDLTNTASVRTLQAPGSIHVVFCQADDSEWDRVATVFAAMTTSLVRGLPS